VAGGPGPAPGYWRAMAMRISLPVSVRRSPDLNPTGVVTGNSLWADETAGRLLDQAFGLRSLCLLRAAVHAHGGGHGRLLIGTRTGR
jgi:hypothetical protein